MILIFSPDAKRARRGQAMEVAPPGKNSKRVSVGALLVSPSFWKSKEPQLIPFYYLFRVA